MQQSEVDEVLQERLANAQNDALAAFHRVEYGCNAGFSHEKVEEYTRDLIRYLRERDIVQLLISQREKK